MKYFILAIILLAGLTAQAQDDKNIPLQKEINGRIRLQEKANQNLSILPEMLLSAFCQGQIKAYYPNRPDVEMSFDNFVSYFNIPYQPDTGTHSCVCDLCRKLDPAFIAAFSEYMDYTGTERLDNRTGTYTYETKYLRIMLPAHFTLTGKEYAGPVFRYADAEKLFSSPVFFNRQNDAAYFTLKQVFAGRLFAPEIKPGKDMWGKPQWNESGTEMELQEVWEQ